MQSRVYVREYYHEGTFPIKVYTIILQTTKNLKL